MWIIVFACLLRASVSAMTDAEAKEQFGSILMTCYGTNPVQMSDLLHLRAMVSPKKTEVKCLLACAYRKMTTMNDKGMFDIEKSYELAEKTKEGDEKGIENGKKMADICIKVNDVSVSDGEKGCERAALMFNCIKENAPKFGFSLD